MDKQQSSASKTDIVMAHSAVGGNWHTIVEGIAQILRADIPDVSFTVTPGSGEGNLARLNTGDIDIGMSTNTSAREAWAGEGSFKEPLKNIRGITQLYTAYVQFIISDKIGINSIADIKEKQYPIRISVHTRGSGIETTAKRTLELYGITYEDIEKWGGKVVFVGSNEAASMMADGQLDAYFGFSAAPIKNFTELELNHTFKVLPIDEPVAKQLEEKYGYPLGNIPAGVYKSVTSEIPTITEAAGLYTRADVPEDIIYKVTKSLIEHRQELGGIHAQLKKLTPEMMPKDLGVPLHPGAEKAYREAGILK
ncbi:MAG TPA: TAXI family TRAP transporter solute-binding subunit [Clostridia bacterium]|nr:TAXI family TRAP transporter solute-binding subunit [Clostridia bacterium]